jgi:ABC-type Na+ transport system ATPase subunit NatA
LEEVEALCDVAVIISEGVVVATGSPQEIRQSTNAASLEDAFVMLTERQTGYV